ncbi:MAG: SDR family oxidoreductase [Sideroxydans sp.]|nr:SDR family oxidoreductase [Sideroxydans sp.]
MLVTGASGFVGQALCAELLCRGHQAQAVVRTSNAHLAAGNYFFVGEINNQTDWTHALVGMEVVIHLAARVHVMHDTSANPLEEFRKVNLQGTENLARQAAAAGVKRFVYVSSIKVNGEQTTDEAFSESDTANPQDPYGVSKWEAEQALHRVAKETGLEVVIVRPPLVYGAGVKGNFISLFAAINQGLPLPLSGAHNLRSLIYVGNLVDALVTCASHPNAVGKTYLVSDGADISTATLANEIALALQCSKRSFYFPPAVLSAIAGLLGKSAQVDRLFGSLQIDSAKIRRELNWTPPYTLQQGLQATAVWYRKANEIKQSAN